VGSPRPKRTVCSAFKVSARTVEQTAASYALEKIRGRRAKVRKEQAMARSSTWSGWIGFAGWLMIIVGSIDFFEGLIAIIRDQYYVLAPNQIIVFDMSTWGWVSLIWGIVVALAGFGLLSGSGWARWFAIVAGSLNFIVQLSFVGGFRYPLWALTGLALTLVVLYALVVHWEDARELS
jgi:hypothetical protein